MTRRPRRSAVAALGAAMALTLSASGASLAQEAAPDLTSDITEYPNYGGSVDCEAGMFNGLPYTGNLQSITAPDAGTVVFTLCNPDVAFLPKIAFSALGIDDADYLIEHMADGSILDQPNGTGPYKLEQWDRGNRMVMTAFEDYWNDERMARTPTFELRWSAEAAQRFTELLSGAVDGIDNPGADDMPAIEADGNLTLLPREGLNTFYLGMNSTYEPWTDVNVRKAIAMGIDRQRIVDNFYPPGSETASHFTPCSLLGACGGDSWYEFDPEGAKALLAEAGYPDGFSTKLQFRDAVRPYLPDPPVIAQEIQAQLKQNLNIDAEIELMESATFLDSNEAGTLEGIFLLGWGADYPDTDNFLNYHFGPGVGKKFGGTSPELIDAIRRGGQTSDPAEREAAYAEANDLIKEQVPAAIIAHGGNGTAWKSDVDGAHSSPLTTEIFSVMQAGDRETLVFMQNSEPLSIYCGDETDGETLRACEQIKESLYGYEIGGGTPVPALAKECVSNDELTVWTCTLQEGVTFHNGATLDASDVIVSLAAQWDLDSPQHVGRDGQFGYWPSMIGGAFLNTPPEEPAE
jgi:peptide/nickel transport system substrate-binding protein